MPGILDMLCPDVFLNMSRYVGAGMPSILDVLCPDVLLELPCCVRPPRLAISCIFAF